MKKIMLMLAMLATSFAMQAQTKFHDAEAMEAFGNVKSITVSVMGQTQTSTFDESGKLVHRHVGGALVRVHAGGREPGQDRAFFFDFGFGYRILASIFR